MCDVRGGRCCILHKSALSECIRSGARYHPDVMGANTRERIPGAAEGLIRRKGVGNVTVVEIERASIVVISDYAKGFLTERVARFVMEAARGRGCAVIVDPRPEHRAW